MISVFFIFSKYECYFNSILRAFLNAIQLSNNAYFHLFTAKTVIYIVNKSKNFLLIFENYRYFIYISNYFLNKKFF